WAKTGATPGADRFLPANLCSYARAFYEGALQLAQSEDIFLLVDCCDSNRRLADALEETFPGKIFLLSLPRSRKYWSFFSAELERLSYVLESRNGNTLSWERLESAYARVEELRKA